MKTSKILTKAKKYLWDGVTRKEAPSTAYICFAVETACRNAKKLEAKASRSYHLCNEIESRLDGHATVRGWLVSKGVPMRQMTIARVQAHRHAWLDQLIAEYQQKGD